MAFEAHVRRWRSGLLVAGSFAFVLIGLWLVGVFGAPPFADPKAVIAGWAGIAFFGLCGLGWSRRLFKAGLEMRIDGNGIWWRRWSDQTIPWSAVERIDVMQMRNQRFVSLFLKDPKAFPSTTILGKLAGANKAMGFGDIVLTSMGSDQSFDAMMAAVERFEPRA